jgi:ParB/RepB/Spo0J family partition protein
MNAPTTAAALAKPSLQLLALNALVPSKSHVQELRRARFKKDSLQKLAEDIGRNGILQPPLVRPLAAGKYELVYGERRYLGAKLAGMSEIYASVRELTDDQALEAQLSENLEREDLHELEEAEGYEELMKLKKLKIDQLVDYFGASKSRSTIYARLKLLALCPEARKAFYDDKLDASKALLIARIGHHDTQRQALKAITEGRYVGAGPMSYREAHEYIVQHFMLALQKAPFDIKDAKLLPAAGDCIKCPKRTGNQTDLFGDVKSADVCTDPKCFDDKRQAHYAADVRKLEAAGKKVIAGAAAKKLMPHWENGSDYMTGYTPLDKTDYIGGRQQKIKDVVGKDYQPVLIQHPGTGKVIEVATHQAISAASEKKTSAKKSSSRASHKRQGPCPLHHRRDRRGRTQRRIRRCRPLCHAGMPTLQDRSEEGEERDPGRAQEAEGHHVDKADLDDAGAGGAWRQGFLPSAGPAVRPAGADLRRRGDHARRDHEKGLGLHQEARPAGQEEPPDDQRRRRARDDLQGQETGVDVRDDEALHRAHSAVQVGQGEGEGEKEVRIQRRKRAQPDGTSQLGAVLISESKEESKLLDELFGTKVDVDGLISRRVVECRVADGFREHYLYVLPPEAPQ